jgi:hypothetical protein
MKRREGKRTRLFCFRLSEEEWGFLQKQADELGMVMSDFARAQMRVRVVREKKKEYREVAAQIAKVGNNLNQIAKWVNTYKSAADTADVIMLLADMWGDLKKIKAMVKGE